MNAPHLDDTHLRDATTFRSTHKALLETNWTYPILSPIDTSHEYEHAQKLFEFSHRVLVHNRDINDRIPYPLPLSPPSFNVKVPLNTTLLRVDTNVVWFFYSSDMNICVLAFTGTYNRMLTYSDMAYNQMEPKTIYNYCNGMYAHGGFLSLYRGIQIQLLDLLNKYINGKTQILITGFSMGGATSTLASLDLYKRKLENGTILDNIRFYSFASPRVLNNVGAKYYNSLDIPTYRLVNDSDVVTAVPGPIMPITQDFTHVGDGITFNDNMLNLYDNHVTAYIKYYKL